MAATIAEVGNLQHFASATFVVGQRLGHPPVIRQSVFLSRPTQLSSITQSVKLRLSYMGPPRKMFFQFSEKKLASVSDVQMGLSSVPMKFPTLDGSMTYSSWSVNYNSKCSSFEVYFLGIYNK